MFRAVPSRREELRLFREGYEFVAGVDEAGRGPMAGPVVAAAVVLPKRMKGARRSLIRDSKQLTPRQREDLFSYIQAIALSVGIGRSGPEEIDRLGIVPATRLAVRRAVEAMPLQPQFLLLDAFPVSDLPISQKAIVHGDALYTSIAAASIVAKVARDRMMVKAGEAYPMYGFERHKGYPTAEHVQSLKRHGPCAIHRRTWAPVRVFLNGNHV